MKKKKKEKLLNIMLMELKVLHPYKRKMLVFLSNTQSSF